MADTLLDELEQDYDPLAVDDSIIDQQDMDDDNPYDTTDYPTLRNMPEDMRREAVYTPERMGSVRTALLELLDHNPGRRPVLLGIINLCREGCLSSELSQTVKDLQESNLSVYSPMTLCRMLERAGALELEMPEVSETHEDVEAGVEYLEIKERVDPIWHATSEGLDVYEEMTNGAAFRDIVLNRDAAYLEVYAAVMGAVGEEPRSKAYIEELVDTFDVVKKPRRFGGHFIDMLERTDAFEWKNHAWQLTDLGRKMTSVVQGAAAAAIGD